MVRIRSDSRTDLNLRAGRGLPDHADSPQRSELASSSDTASSRPGAWRRLALTSLTTSVARLHPLTRAALTAVLVSSVCVNAALIVLFSTSHNDTALKYPVIYARLAQSDDSWGFMEPAFLYTRTPDRGPLYESLFFGSEQFKFLYPPSSLLVYWILYAEPINTALGAAGVGPTDILKIINYVLIPATIPVVAWLYLRPSGEHSSTMSRQDVIITLVCLSVLLATFRPVMRGLELGQIQVWITFGLVTMFVIWTKERKGWCGVIAGLICLVKPQYGLILLWALVRREVRFSLAMVITGLAGISVSILVFGLWDHLDYVRLLSFLSQRGEAYFPNQSPNGLMNRLLFNGNMMAFTNEYPPYNLIVHATTVISQIAIVGWALFGRSRIAKNDRIFDLIIFMLAMTLSSPLAWEHHYGFIIAAYVILAVRIVSRPRNRYMLVLLLTSYTLASNDFEALNALAYTPWNFLMSYLLLAGSLVLILLYTVSEKTMVTPPMSTNRMVIEASTTGRGITDRLRALSRQ
jgi:alpha-1,2-mannosyltransferase